MGTQFAADYGINLGMVSFAGSATLLVSPTTRRERCGPGDRHAPAGSVHRHGEGLFAALQAIEALSAVVGGVDGPPRRGSC